MTTVDEDGQMSQISLSGELKRSSSDPSGSTLVTEITASKTPLDSGTESTPSATTTQTIEIPVPDPSVSAAAPPTPSTPPPPPPTVFRDPLWLANETSYLAAAIADLNSKARSYNLQAPELARKPYFNLERELRACYSDVAPLLAGAIVDRARKPTSKVSDSFGQQLSERGLLGTLGGAPVRIRDERTTKQYGFRQFWSDLFAPKAKDPWA
ncbi:hypothetical protein OPT61_g5821 [Boeremia exigua]|uniref:Uncharacterized protein n=1 Tax=Boeremia exigua TaxID=749465 RepID=A0ACC2I8Z8_9PLEO|nr:hypothetical protein OPT61_g5821 [Boeremia exigua]